ncbi:4-hydroxybenzoyl-CoA reductase subunit gamma [Andreesenia angusta]|uniref:4-hydroxybenzoyl-CoA reductase subunit gamma n=1 Tax=Andreesenia angusta TaxID=39480 RepID=A0A1S1V7S1_9FIRM|nr:(2Fe-2S)-binding protein [Andreesenia angusta]OHW62465.1 4-hydroxybenzoyl-CoA reductase subunit gamma [Andreesenia angusta]
MQIKLNINGSDKTLDVKPHEFLVEVLRENGYLGVKKGCETGNCGLCTILIDDKPVLSCSYLAVRAEGKKITTIEGVQAEAAEVGSFLVEEGVDQCGYCSPGLVMTIIGMKKEIENPTEDDIRNYLTNNLCRCTGYVGQLRAIKKLMGVE